jgi:sugar lactone lactonase YvrE
MRVDYHFLRSFVTNFWRDVGFSELINGRGILPQIAPDNTNSVWMAPNGTPGGAGTQADPVDDLSIANGLLGGAKTTIHIFRNGYDGDMVFTEASAVTLASTHNIQVENGEKATINIPAHVFCTSNNTLNGVYFSGGYVQIQGGAVVVENCGFDVIGGVRATTAGTSPKVRYCYFELDTTSATAYCLDLYALTYTVENCIFVNKGSQLFDFSGSAYNPEAFKINLTNVGLTNSTLRRCVFVNFGNIFHFNFISEPASTGHTHTISDSLFYNTNYLIKTNATDPSLDNNTININRCLDLTSAFANLLSATTVPAGFITNINNAIDKDTALMFVDEADILAVGGGDKDSFRLQYKGKATPDGSGKYFIDSGLVGLSGQSSDIKNTFRTARFDASATNPTGIGYDYSNNTLWVLDTATNKVYNITIDGTLISSFSGTVIAGGVTSMQAICLDIDKTHLWVTDDTTQKFYKITKTGTVIHSFLYSVAGFTDALGIDMDFDGSLWVAARVGTSIVQVDTDGNLLSSFATTSIDPTYLIPTGLLIDRNNNTLWWTEANNNFVIQTTKAGVQISLSSILPTTQEIAYTDEQRMFSIETTNDSIYLWSLRRLEPINPFEEETIILSETFNDFIELNWPPTNFTFDNIYKNNIVNNDVNGNLDRDYDTERKKFVFEFGDTIHISNRQAKQLRDLLADKGTKKFYPLGINSNLFEEDESTVSTGIYSSTDDSIIPSGVASELMVNGWWRGFWITIGNNDYYINDNDETKLYITDVLGHPLLTNGTVDFIISYILIQTEAGNYLLRQQHFTEFTKGGRYRESNEEIRAFDLATDSLTFEEVENRKEGS